MGTTATANRETVTRAEAALDIATARRRGGRGPRGGNGRGPNGGGPGGGGPGGDDRRRGFSPDRYRIGVLVGLASILMMFTALASAYIVRSGRLPNWFDWSWDALPSFVYLSTALIVVSSFTFTRAKAALGQGEEAAYRVWLGVTLLLGLGFLASQLLAWRQLVARGVYLASNPQSSFFYVLTGLHGLHLAGGILALSALMVYERRARGPESDVKRRTLTDVVGIYWHFMDLLWVFLFLLLFLWR